MTDWNNYTDEELLQIEIARQRAAAQQYGANLPAYAMPEVGNAVNDYGQGYAYLGMEDQPESWKRATEAQNQIEDMLKLSGLYLEDILPGLPREVAEPEGERFVDYNMSQFANSPVYQTLDELMKRGQSFDQAVNNIAADEAFQEFLPKNEDDRPDREAFRASAQSYLTGRTKEDAINSEYDAEQAAYDRYVNGTDKYTEMFGGDENFNQIMSGLFRETGENPDLGMIGPQSAQTRSRPGSTPVSSRQDVGLGDILSQATPAAGARLVDRGVENLAGVLDRNIGDPIENFARRLGGGINPGEGPYDMSWNEPATTGRIGDLSLATARPDRATNQSRGRDWQGQDVSGQGSRSTPTAGRSSRQAPKVATVDAKKYNEALRKVMDEFKGNLSTRRGPSDQQRRNTMLLEAARQLRLGGQ
jgi:hypothetical protein